MITIPLLNGADNAHQPFNFQLGDNFLQFTVNFVTLAGPSWSVDISREGVELISGAMLEPNAIITGNYNADIGRLIFVGDDVTLDNLGVDNKLVWLSDDE
tara:strand:+ start:17845 stop:18144 length:300 start_codon:yes stop_codon:yes gene_type:complete